jgi:hypothetical protein
VGTAHPTIRNFCNDRLKNLGPQGPRVAALLWPTLKMVLRFRSVENNRYIENDN